MGRLRFGFLIILVFPAFLIAQSRGGAGHPAAGGHPVAVVSAANASPVAPRIAAPHAQQMNRAVGRATSRVHSRTGTSSRHGNNFGFGSDQVDFQDVPGLGFDYPHLAATSGNRRVRGSRVNGAFSSGFDGFLLSPSIIFEDPQSSEPQGFAEGDASVEIPQAEPQRRPRRSHMAVQPQPAAEAAPPAPQPDAEQYVFVRRDGSLFFGVAYSWENGNLRYVTPEGFRRSINSEALDLAATQQFNEQRGLSFRAPA